MAMMSFQYYQRNLERVLPTRITDISEIRDKITQESAILFECACVQETNKHSYRMTNLSQCHQTILQPALIIGTSISAWRVIWSG